MNYSSASVVICCSDYRFNQSRLLTLEQTLLGLSKQSARNFEVILVVFPDTTMIDSILVEYSELIHIKTIIVNSNNLPKKRNVGVAKSKSNIVMFIDDDATPNKKWVETAIRSIKSTHAHVIGGSFISYSNSYLSRFQAMYYSWGGQNVVKKVDTVIGANMCLDKALCSQFLGKNRRFFDESLYVAGEDSDFSLRISQKNGLVYFVPQLKVIHVYRSNSIHFFRRQMEYAMGDLQVLNKNKKSRYLSKYRHVFLAKSLVGRFLLFARVCFWATVEDTRNLGIYWLPAVLLRECSYATGLFLTLRNYQLEK